MTPLLTHLLKRNIELSHLFSNEPAAVIRLWGPSRPTYPDLIYSMNVIRHICLRYFISGISVRWDGDLWLLVSIQVCVKDDPMC